MLTIGIRVAPARVSFAIYDAVNRSIISVEEILVPAAFELPEAFKYIRSNVLDVLREYGVEKAGIRTSEPVAQSFSVLRLQLEGVIQEAFASSCLKGYFAGPISVIASMLRVSRDQIKPIIKGRNDLEIENWNGMSEEHREAILSAVGAVNA